MRLNRPLWEFCRQFRAQGGRVWIVSTGSRANIDNAMRHLGITVAGQLTGSTAPAGCAGMDEAGMVGAGKGTTATGMDGAGVEGTGKGTAGADVDTTGAGNTAPGAAGSYTATAGTGAATPGAAWDPAPGEGPNGAVDGILSGADVEHSKPAPDCFLEAMRREGCTPQETLIFEDSEIGLEAARRSGASYFVVKLDT